MLLAMLLTVQRKPGKARIVKKKKIGSRRPTIVHRRLILWSWLLLWDFGVWRTDAAVLSSALFMPRYKCSGDILLNANWKAQSPLLLRNLRESIRIHFWDNRFLDPN